jgi:hypothetical protein
VGPAPCGHHIPDQSYLPRSRYSLSSTLILTCAQRLSGRSYGQPGSNIWTLSHLNCVSRINVYLSDMQAQSLCRSTFACCSYATSTLLAVGRCCKRNKRNTLSQKCDHTPFKSIGQEDNSAPSRNTVSILVRVGENANQVMSQCERVHINKQATKTSKTNPNAIVLRSMDHRDPSRQFFSFYFH